MLNRRQLRIKTLQTLYAFYQSGNNSLASGERELSHSIEKVFDLYFFVLNLVVEVKNKAERVIEEKKNKHLPTKEDLNPNTRFIDNAFINQLENNKEFIKNCERRKISWADNQDFIKKTFRLFEESEVYNHYMNSEGGYNKDKEIVAALITNFVLPSEEMDSLLEEKSIYWVSDLDLVISYILKTIKSFKPSTTEDSRLLKGVSFNNGLSMEDREYTIDLYRKSISHNDKFEELIKSKTQNWELDRIALLDIILMKMALCEILYFPSIPVKVTLNEYIEISKYFSTPKSKVFINGILDKIIKSLELNNEIKKTGRGLVDN